METGASLRLVTQFVRVMISVDFYDNIAALLNVPANEWHLEYVQLDDAADP